MNATEAKEKPCIYKFSCGYDICMKSDCPDYVAKTRNNSYYGKEDKENNNECNRD